MLMILSPAKTLDLSSCDQRLCGEWTFPDCDKTKTLQVVAVLKNRSPKELASLLNVSQNLAKTAHEYWSKFDIDLKKQSDQKPCIFCFSGAAYQGLHVDSCSDKAVSYMQKNLRIVDPLYGVLRPLDVMQPYRLEMASKNVFPDAGKIKLAEYWRPSVSEFLAKDLSRRENKTILNLASEEYSAAVDTAALPDGTRFIKVVFWEDGRTISIHAKRARGLMVRYLAEHAVETIEEVQKFNDEGYSFVESKSDETMMVFDRRKQPCANKKKTSPASKSRTDPAPKRSRRK